MYTKKLVKRIAEFHKNYELKFLKDRIENKDIYLTNPKDALFFVLSFSFYQGRRDKISEQLEKRAMNTLNRFLENNPDYLSLSKRRITNKNELKKAYNQLYDELERNELNKEGDRLMVISLVNLIQSESEKNILKFLMGRIKSDTISDAYKELDGIWSIGPKITSLILRDTVYIYGLERYLKRPDDYYFLQPIDTWVHKISYKIGMTNKEKIYTDEAKDIVNKCFEFDVNPIHYNQGAWYIGANSLQVLLEILRG